MNLSALATRVTAVLKERLQPILMDNGSDVTLVDVNDAGVVKLRLAVACRSCPASVMTLVMMIEQELSTHVPEAAYFEFESQ